MKINVLGRHVEVSDALRSYVVSKVEGLEKYFDRMISVDVTMAVEKERQIVEMVAHLINKKIVKSSAASKDMYASIDAAIDKLGRQLRRYNARVKRKEPWDHSQDLNPKHQVQTQDQRRNSRQIIRQDTIIRKPMSPEEAAMQLEAYHRNFLVFINSEDDRPSIIYDREDGNYGLISLG
ncbi:MAG: ribosome hibernation-promoting factor, HPF/YfiA family [Candidatus Bipolaricaulia bacterium]